MKILEHWRHSMRNPLFQHLNQKGVNLARQISSSIGVFNLVVTSTVLRAIETAVAMGFAVNLSIKDECLVKFFIMQIPLEVGLRVWDY